MFNDRNSIFFTGFILGAIFSYSGMMGFLGGCITGALVVSNFGKNIMMNDIMKSDIMKSDPNKSEVDKSDSIKSDLEWTELEDGKKENSHIFTFKNMFTGYFTKQK